MLPLVNGTETDKCQCRPLLKIPLLETPHMFSIAVFSTNQHCQQLELGKSTFQKLFGWLLLFMAEFLTLTPELSALDCCCGLDSVPAGM